MMKQSESHDTKEKESTVDEEFPLLRKIRNDLDPSNPKILDLMVQNHIDVVGEDDNIKLLFLAAVSRKLPKKLRIHIINYGSSGSGKSWTIRRVLKPFWKNVKEVTRYTEAWLNGSADDLDEKILLLQEINKTDEHGNGTTGQIKIMITDEGLSYGKMDHSSGEWVPINKHSEALPVMITTTTRQMNKEDARRFFILNNDESEEQTSNIVKQKLKEASSVRLTKEIQEKYEQLKGLAEFYEKAAIGITGTVVPFAPKLKEMLPKHLEMRTDTAKLIQLIQLVAFIHISNRKFVITKDAKEKYLVADIEDLKEAICIGSKILNQSNSGLSSKSMEIYEHVKNIVYNDSDDFSGDYPTQSRCEFDLQIPHSTFLRHLDPLIDGGYIEKANVEGSKEKCLMLTFRSLDKISVDDIEFTDDEFSKWFEREFDENYKIVDARDTLTC